MKGAIKRGTSPIVLLSFLFLGCLFNPQVENGKQRCSSDNPPQCLAGYTCVAGLCYAPGDKPDAGGEGRKGDACVPQAIACKTGAGKLCGKVPDGCGGTVSCGTCIAGETCLSAKNQCAVACGKLKEPCCTGSTCSEAGSVCSNGICEACGEPNGLCCANQSCPAAGTLCALPNTAGDPASCLLPCAGTVKLKDACATGTDLACVLACGPDRVGYKTCDCASGSWNCPNCLFIETANYSCYKLPATGSPPACLSTGLPKANADCSAATCATCGSATAAGYLDSSGTATLGYCVCSTGKWSCAPAKQWPCPGNPGCGG